MGILLTKIFFQVLAIVSQNGYKFHNSIAVAEKHEKNS